MSPERSRASSCVSEVNRPPVVSVLRQRDRTALSDSVIRQGPTYPVSRPGPGPDLVLHPRVHRAAQAELPQAEL